jgi:cyclopropane fatty-acyl-phospholipid synthase-like methyltransferase
MTKVKLAPLVKSVVSRAAHPMHLAKAFSLHRNRKKNRHHVDDAQLKLYSEILPREFLHFGYFEDPDILPDDMSLNELLDAQQRYADMVLDQVIDRTKPVLDIGCGMGALSAMLEKRGFTPVALTPDRFQIAHIQKKYPSIETVQTKFERLSVAQHAGRYGTLLNSESLQYLKLDLAVPLMEQLLQPGGRWVVCDFFYREACKDKSCHVWGDFCKRITDRGWRMTCQQEITANALPTLKYVHMWGARLGIPLMRFGQMKMKKKQPGLFHLVEKALSSLESFAAEQITSIDPEIFGKKHQYMLLVLER